MKYNMRLTYVTETMVEVTVRSDADGVTVETKDGDFKNHFALLADDAVELANMFAKASQHTRELNNKK